MFNGLLSFRGPIAGMTNDSYLTTCISLIISHEWLDLLSI